MGFWRGLCCIPRRKHTKSVCLEETIVERIPEENDFDQVVPGSFNESSDAKAAMSKKSQFEDLLDSKENELGLEDMGAYGDQKAAMNETITLLRKNSSASSSSSIVSASAIAQIPSMETSSDMISYSSDDTEEISENHDPNDTKASLRAMLSRSLDNLESGRSTAEINESFDCKIHDARYSLDPVSIGHMRMNIANKLDSGKQEDQKLAEYEYKGDELRNLISAKIEELEEGEISDESDDDPIYEPGSTQSDDSYTISDEDGFEPNEQDLSEDDVSVQEMLDLHGEDLESLRRRLSVLNKDVTSFQDEFIERRRMEAEGIAEINMQEESNDNVEEKKAEE